MSAPMRPAGGFSLVELLVAMVLGLLLIGGTITIFVSNVRSAELGQSISAMQANARFALDEIASSVRVAGSRGCMAGNRPMRISAIGVPLDGADPGSSTLVGVRVSGTDWAPDELGGYVAPSGRGAPVAGSDALLVQHAVGPGERVDTAMGSAGSYLEVDGDVHDLLAGDLAIVTDCVDADLFRIDARTGSAGSIALQPDRTLSKGYAPSADAANPRAVFVLPFASAMYYVGDTGRRTRAGDAVRSLYVQEFPYTPATNAPLELIEGVDLLRLSFVQRAADGSVRLRSTTDTALDDARVTAVRVGFLMSSSERLDAGTTPRVFSLAGTTAHPQGATGASADAAFYPSDARLRVAFERSVAVRNRGLEARQP